MGSRSGPIVVIAGFTGLIGRYLVRTAPPGTQLSCIARRHDYMSNAQFPVHLIDLLTSVELLRLIHSIEPDIIIHAAGESRVDIAAHNVEAARVSIVGSTQALSRAAADVGARFVYVSSNAVFGLLPPPYSSRSPYSPMNTYGNLKVEAEKTARANCVNSIIVRPLLTYGWTSPLQRKSLVEQWINKLNAGEKVKALIDTFNSPIYGMDCAGAIWTASLSINNADYNIGGAEETSLYHFALRVADAFGLNPDLIVPCTVDELGLAANRPKVVAYERDPLLDQGAVPLRGIELSLADMRREHF